MVVQYFYHSKTDNMKAIIIIICLGFILPSHAQDTAKVEQYCIVEMKPVFLSRKVTMLVDYGGKRNDSTFDKIKDENGEVVKFNSYIDAFNYMGKLGWKLVWPPGVGFLFKREISKVEADKTGTVPSVLQQ